jgi:hypothetical protein
VGTYAGVGSIDCGVCAAGQIDDDGDASTLCTLCAPGNVWSVGPGAAISSACNAADAALIGTISSIDDANPVLAQVTAACGGCAGGHLAVLAQTALSVQEVFSAVLDICYAPGAIFHAR